MFCYLGVVVLSLWILYNCATMLYAVLPYLDLYHGGNAIIEVLHIISLRWSGVVGIALLAVGVLGMIFGRREENNFSGMKLPAIIIGLLFSVLLVV